MNVRVPTSVAALLAVLAAVGAPACDGGASGARASDARPARVTIVGTCLRAATGEPLEGATVTGPGGVRARSGPRGEFELSGLARGTSGELRAEFDGGLFASVPLRPLADDRLEVVLHLRRP